MKKSEEKKESPRKEKRERKRGGEKKTPKKKMTPSGSLSASARKKIPKADFGLPGAKSAKGGKGKYPMPNRSHASNAKARAKQMLDKGKLSQSQYDKIVAKANKKLGKKKK